jgi:lipopolysaccharide/colanic/teichoic acid biosynthesis glycosyltransferase
MVLAGAMVKVEADPAGLQLRSLWAKRLIDVTLGVPLCLVAAPVIALLATVLAVQLRANPFFVHDRLGRHGRLVAIPKLRTLVPHTDPYADKTRVVLQPPTAFARMLRLVHLDELPQLFLVPFGRLSLVGPRPRMLVEADEHGDDEYEAIRTSVHQGCTGLWQISRVKASRVSDHPEYDLFYISQHTIRLDLWILWRTLRQALGAPTIGLDDIPRWALRDPDLRFEPVPT